MFSGKGANAMLLTIDMGNSSISIGIFDTIEGKLLNTFKISCDSEKTSDEYVALLANMFFIYGIRAEDINGAITASVVPQLSHVMYKTIVKFIGKEPIVVGPGIKTGFPIRIDDPSELGADLVANAAAVTALMQKNSGKASIIIDMGTATTMSAINTRGEYIGTSIMPGVRIELDSLHSKTAQLPTVTPGVPDRAIGKNSQEAVRSGVILGSALMIDALIDRFEKEMRVDERSIDLYATGGLADIIIPACRHAMSYDPHLTLKGLYHIYQNNIDKNNNGPAVSRPIL